jgi:hypothetical protein
MFESKTMKANEAHALAPLDRLAIGYLILPLFIFLIGWFQWWAAILLVACSAYALRPLYMNWSAPARAMVTARQLVIAVVIGCAWSALGGTDHLFFANVDWHFRDAVLHDLVVSHWPVGYGLHDGQETMLRAPLGFYLTAALIGKATSLSLAYVALLAWTAIGAVLFLLQIMSLVDNKPGAQLLAVAVVVFFSGADIVGSLLNEGPRFRTMWDLPMHLEWWAGSYQYSSMTTQLFWVPNHAFGGWLIIGLLYRCGLASDLELLLPILLAAAALWSPLSALGLVPFVIWRGVEQVFKRHSLKSLQPNNWLPALIVGVTVCAYLTIAAGAVPKGSSVAGWASGDAIMSLLRQTQFFLWEAGLIGLAIALIRPSIELFIALAVLAVLPAVYFGPNNDLVMRASIPALTVLAICAFNALLDPTPQPNIFRKKAFLGVFLLVGAMTPISEISRAIIFPVWPINYQATLIGSNCGSFPPHYVAEVDGQHIMQVLNPPSRLALGPLGPEACSNPASEITYRRYPP